MAAEKEINIWQKFEVGNWNEKPKILDNLKWFFNKEEIKKEEETLTTPPHLIEPPLPTWNGELPEVPRQAELLSLRQTRNFARFAKLLHAVPQVAEGKLKYVVTGGYAVEILVRASGGVARIDHHDLDLIVMTEDGVPKFDNWQLGNYVCVLFFDEQTLVNNL